MLLEVIFVATYTGRNVGIELNLMGHEWSKQEHMHLYNAYSTLAIEHFDNLENSTICIGQFE
jgi:hypothetical protein